MLALFTAYTILPADGGGTFEPAFGKNCEDAAPETCSLFAGDVTPIPTLPELRLYILLPTCFQLTAAKNTLRSTVLPSCMVSKPVVLLNDSVWLSASVEGLTEFPPLMDNDWLPVLNVSV